MKISVHVHNGIIDVENMLKKIMPMLRMLMPMLIMLAISYVEKNMSMYRIMVFVFKT